MLHAPEAAGPPRPAAEVVPVPRTEPPSPERAPLSGTVERVTFHNPENGFCVLRLKVRGRRELVTLIGHAPSVAPGETVQASGEWQNTVDHGLQFKAALLQVTPPDSLEGIERYLGSGLIRGIGKELARRLVKAFGERVFEVVEEHPERLKTVEGIGPIRLQRILDGWAEQRVIRDIMVFLQSHGIGTSRAVRIYKTYGADAVPLISENPYRLARDIRGVGFKTADALALRLGIAKDADVRARAGLAYTLLEAVGAGHCALPESKLLEQAEELLEIPRPILEQALADELAEGELIADAIEGERAIFLAALWAAERRIGQCLHRIAAGSPPWGPIDVAAALAWVQDRLGIELAASQRAAVERALGSPALVITGGPGVGKTTLVRSILSILRAKGVEVALCAPTGRAAKRLAESTGLEARTIHRLLEVDPQRGGFRRRAEHPLECHLLVVDETSMVDVPLMASLLDAVPEGGALLLVGDVDQLPSVGPGQVLRDVIDSGVVPVARLTEIFRQVESSRIVVNAHRVNRGLMPEIAERGAAPSDELTDFYFVDAEDPEDARAKVVEMARRRIPARFGLDPLRDVQVLCPMNRGQLGARAFNLELQAALNPRRAGAAEVERFGWTYRAGDKVMQTENDYDKEVFNGDLGVVETVDPDAQELVVRFDERSIAYRFGELDQIVLAYAITIHKSQGSEYPAIIVPIALQHWVMLQRNLVYTAITRGKSLVVLVGQRRALATAVKGRPMERRYSKVREWIVAPPGG
jgi:exodeoxyribonuclease V alpha subunit